MGGSSSLPERIGGYRVLAWIGDGGMGSVLKAAAPDGRTVAVKVVRGEYASLPAFRERFCREAAAAALVPRFCTAEVLDYDVDGATPFIVTEFIDGPTLQASVHDSGPWEAADLDQLGVSVASALTAIHHAGVVHRDLKPGNVLLSRSGPRVIDFGIARALDGMAGLTASGQPVGTPAFMAPEQCRGEEATPAVDVFAWGGLMVFAAAGRYPFGVGPAHEVSRRVQEEDPDLDGLDQRLRGVVAAALAKNPAARPDAQELLGLLGVRGASTDPLPAAGRRLAGWVPPVGGATAAERRGESAAHPAGGTNGPGGAAPAATASTTAVQTPPPVGDVPDDFGLEVDFALDLDGPATAEMPPVQELRAPRPANRPAPGGGAGDPLPPTVEPAGPSTPGEATTGPATPAPPAEPPASARLRAARSIGRTLLVVGVLVMLAALGLYAVAGVVSGDDPVVDVPAGADAGEDPASVSQTETYSLAVGAAVTTGRPAPGAGDLSNPDEHEVYEFEGIRGQKLFLTASSCEPTPNGADFAPTWTLTDPAGQRLGSGTLCADPAVDPELPTLPVNGRYQLAIQADDGATGRFSFLLSAPAELPGDTDDGRAAQESAEGPRGGQAPAALRG